jgi:hypothetical protein
MEIARRIETAMEYSRRRLAGDHLERDSFPATPFRNRIDSDPPWICPPFLWRWTI